MNNKNKVLKYVLIFLVVASSFMVGCISRKGIGITLTLTQHGIECCGRPFSRTEIKDFLKRKVRSFGPSSISILCDKNVKLGDLSDLIDTCRMYGFFDINLATSCKQGGYLYTPIEVLVVDSDDRNEARFPGDVQLYFHFSGANYYVNGQHFSSRDKALNALSKIAYITNTVISCSVRDQAGQLLKVLEEFRQGKYTEHMFVSFTTVDDKIILNAINEARERGVMVFDETQGKGTSPVEGKGVRSTRAGSR